MSSLWQIYAYDVGAVFDLAKISLTSEASNFQIYLLILFLRLSSVFFNLSDSYLISDVQVWTGHLFDKALIIIASSSIV